VSDHDRLELRRPWSRTDRLIPRVVLRPLQDFLTTSVAGGVVLLMAVVVALAWANSPWQDAYRRLWIAELGVRVGGWSLELDLRHWVNDLLMGLFFVVVGLEVKRELVLGQLRSVRSAGFPVAAALGGMAVPAAVYALVNLGGDGLSGWAVPMATDIAFALGVLTLAAGASTRGVISPLLLTLAVVDDIGAIVVIAVFYSGGVAWGWLGAAALVVALIALLERIHVRHATPYLVLAALLWYATLRSGIHPTVAGVALGLLAPIHPFQRARSVGAEARRIANQTVDDPNPPDADAEWWARLSMLAREAVSPLVRLEHGLLQWTSFVVIPLFALANAGIVLSSHAIAAAFTSRIVLGIVMGLVIGKPLGVWLATTVAAGAGLVVRPAGITWRNLMGLMQVAGVGFTMSIFIAELAFREGPELDAAKVGILFASILAAALAAAWWRTGSLRRARSLPPPVDMVDP
jgi:NhaA family Na+:H+ antiporter